MEIDGILPEKDDHAEVEDSPLCDFAVELQQNLQLQPNPKWKAKLKERLLDAYDWQFNK